MEKELGTKKADTGADSEGSIVGQGEQTHIEERDLAQAEHEFEQQATVELEELGREGEEVMRQAAEQGVAVSATEQEALEGISEHATITRRGLFGRLARIVRGQPSSTEEPAVPFDDTSTAASSTMSRRRVLEVGTVAAAGAVLRPEIASAANEEFERYAELIKPFRDFSDRMTVEYGRPMRRTLAEVEEVRTAFQAAFSREEVYALLDAAETWSISAVKAVFSHLARADSQGIAYQYLRENGLFEEYQERRLGIWRFAQTHFFTRAEDFLPTGAEISDDEIDPRLRIHTDPALEKDEKHRASIEATIERRPGWATAERQQAFRTVIDVPEVRTVFEQSNCTLAEVYSVIKACIKRQEEYQKDHAGYTFSNVATAEMVHQLLQDRQALFDMDPILDENTDCFIHLSYYEEGARQMRPETMHTLADACHVSKRNRVEVDTSQEDAHEIENDIYGAVADSRGRTVLYLDTHGEENRISTREGAPGFYIENIASALMSRIIETRDPQTVKDVVIIADACHSYILAKQIEDGMRNRMETIYGTGRKRRKNMTVAELPGVAGFRDVALPTIISSAQEGSLGYTTQKYQDAIPAIRKRGALTAEFIMRRLQPRDYHIADFTFFRGGQGAIHEIGEVEHQDVGQRVA